MDSLDQINQEIIDCQRCTRLSRYISEVARTRRAAYRAQDYWGKPVPGWGDPDARLWIIGLAPGAHGSNRTGRMFTGDRSGDFLYAALHRAGMANQPVSIWRDDHLKLNGVYISAVGRCAPPKNKLLPDEIRACRTFLLRELECLSEVRAILALGKVAFDATWSTLNEAGFLMPNQKPRFAHGAAFEASNLRVKASYHVSQQNTFTGKLTPDMFDRILASLF